MAGAGDIRAGGAYVEISTQESKFNAGLARIQDRMNKMAAGLRAVGTKIFLLGTASLGGLGIAIRSFSNVGSELTDMSARTGVSVEALSELGFAARMGGSDLAGVEDAVKHMQRVLGDAAEGTDSAVKALRDLGLTMNDLRGKSPDQQLELIGNRLAAIRDPAQRASAAIAVFSRSGTKVLAWAGDLAKARERARALGITMSGDTAASADELGDAFDTLKMVAGRSLFNIGAILAPVAMRLIDDFSKILGAVNNWIKENPRLAGVIGLLTVAALGLGVVLFGLGLAIKAVGIAAIVPATMYRFFLAALDSTKTIVVGTISALYQVGKALTAITLLLHKGDMKMVGMKVFKPLRAIIFGMIFPTFRTFKARVEALGGVLLALGKFVGYVVSSLAKLGGQAFSGIIRVFGEVGKAIMGIRFKGGLLSRIFLVIKGASRAVDAVFVGIGIALVSLGEGALIAAKAMGRVLMALGKFISGLPLAKIFGGIAKAAGMLAAGLLYLGSGIGIVATTLFKLISSTPVMAILKGIGIAALFLAAGLFAVVEIAGSMLASMFKLLGMIPLSAIIEGLGQGLQRLGRALANTAKAAAELGAAGFNKMVEGIRYLARGIADLIPKLLKFMSLPLRGMMEAIANGLYAMGRGFIEASKAAGRMIAKAYNALDALMTLKVPLLSIPNIMIHMPRLVAPPLDDLKLLFLILKDHVEALARGLKKLLEALGRFAMIAAPAIIRGLIAAMPMLKDAIVSIAFATWEATKAIGKLAQTLYRLAAKGAIAGLKMLGNSLKELGRYLLEAAGNALKFVGEIIRLYAVKAGEAAMRALRASLKFLSETFWSTLRVLEEFAVAMWKVAKSVYANYIVPALESMVKGLGHAMRGAGKAALAFGAAMKILWNSRYTSLYFNIVRKGAMSLLNPLGLLARAVAIMAGYAIWFPPAAVGGGALLLGDLHGIASVIPTLFKGMGAMLGNVFRIIMASWGAVMDDLMAGDFENAWAVTCAMMRAAWAEVVKWLTERWQTFKAFFKDAFGVSVNDMWAEMQKGFVDAVAVIEDMWSAMSNRMKNIWTRSLNVIGNVTSQVMGWALGASPDVVAASISAENAIGTGAIATNNQQRERDRVRIEEARVEANRRVETARQTTNERDRLGLPNQEASEAATQALWDLEAVLHEAGMRQAERERLRRQRAGEAGDDAAEGKEVSAKGTFSSVAAAGMGGGMSVFAMQLRQQEMINANLLRLIQGNGNLANAVRGLDGAVFN